MNIRKVSDVLLYISLICILMLFVGIFFRGEKDISLSENRTLEKIPEFSIDEFLSGKYQDQLELSIADQLVFGGTIKIKSNALKTNIVSKANGLLSAFLPNDIQTYNAISPNYFLYGDSDYIVEKAYLLDDYKTAIKEIGNHYNNAFKCSEQKIYLYFINNSRTVDFTYPKEKTEIFECVKDNFNADQYAYLKINSFAQYANFFYKTDHHWNYKGWNQGYHDIIDMLFNGMEKPLKPIGTKKFDVEYRGTYARGSSYFDNQDEFIVYEYPPLKDHDMYVNGEKVDSYGNQQAYENGTESKALLETHYSSYHGASTGEIIYDFHDAEKENLLMVTRSYSVAIRELIASHFNKTYIIDPRYFAFSPQTYMEDKDIHKVLYLGDISTFAYEEIDLKEEK